MTQIFRATGHYEMTGMYAHEGSEHGTDPMEIRIRHADTYRNRSPEQQDVLQHTHPRHRPDSTCEHEGGHDNGSNNHSRRAANAFKTGYPNDDSKTSELQLHVWYDGHDADE